jgi:methyl-accepting chemotaxis protein
MTNSSSQSKALIALVAALVVVIATDAVRFFVGPVGGELASLVEIVVIAGLLAVAARLMMRASQRIRSAALVCERAFHGDLEARILDPRDGGELGKLQKSINDMLDILDAYVRESAASMEYVSRGKTFRKVLLRGLPGSFRNGATVINAGVDAMDRRVQELATKAKQFGDSMDHVAKQLASAAGSLRSDSTTLATASEEASRQSSTVAAAAEEASTNVQTVASAAEELSSSIAEISRQVQRSTASTSKAVNDAKQTNQQIQNLAESAQRIGDVVKLISEIASQTNLLALNATIEAARAGEAGKGFAVVASEVKSLATQTAKATEEISAKITEMQAATSLSVQAVQTIGETIGEINEVSATIASAVEEQGAATKEIARNVQEASTGTSEVSANVTGISQAAAETGQAATRVNSASQQISAEVETLRQAVEGFLMSMKAA